MKFLQLTSFGLHKPPNDRININFDKVKAFYPTSRDENDSTTTIAYDDGNITYVNETFDEISDSLRKVYG